MQRHYYAIQVANQAALSSASFSIPLIAHALGAPTATVGLIVSAYAAAQFVANALCGRAADMHGRKRLLQVGLAASAITVALAALARSPGELLMARAAFGFAAGMYPAALLSLAHDENRRLGKFTGLGSLGFSIGVLAGGVAGAWWHVSVFVLAAGLLTLAFAASLLIRFPPEHNVRVPVFPAAVVRRNLPAYTAMMLRHVGASAVWAIFPLYLVSLGADVFLVGVVSAVNGVFQYLFMARVGDRFPAPRLVLAGLVLSAVCFVLFALAPNLWWLIAAQPVLAASWTCIYLGTLRFVLDRNVERATSTGLLQSSIHLSNIIGPVVGGLAAQAYGYHVMMYGAAALALVGVPLFMYETRREPLASLDDLPGPRDSASHMLQAAFKRP